MTQYTLRGKRRPEISFTIADLRPLPMRRQYDFDDLLELVSYKHYHPLDDSFKEDYILLYHRPECKGINFFQVGASDAVIIPGETIHPTELSAAALRSSYVDNDTD